MLFHHFPTHSLPQLRHLLFPITSLSVGRWCLSISCIVIHRVTVISAWDDRYICAANMETDDNHVTDDDRVGSYGVIHFVVVT